MSQPIVMVPRIKVSTTYASSHKKTLEEACIMMNTIGYLEVNRFIDDKDGETVIMDYQY